MIKFEIPPKPGQVFIDEDAFSDILNIRGHEQKRDSLLLGAGFAISSTLLLLSDTQETASVICNEIVDQVSSYVEQNYTGIPKHVSSLNPTSTSVMLNYGFRRGIEAGLMQHPQPLGDY